MEQSQPKPICSQEALDLLNCVTQNPYDQNKCILLLDALRNCVTRKNVKKFTLADQDEKEASATSNSKKS